MKISLVPIMCCGKKKQESTPRKTKKKTKKAPSQSDEKPEEKQAAPAEETESAQPPAPDPAKDAYDPQYQTMHDVTSEKVFGPVEQVERKSFSYDNQSPKEAEWRQADGFRSGNGDRVHSHDPYFKTSPNFEQGNISNGHRPIEQPRVVEPGEQWSTSEKNVPKPPFAPMQQSYLPVTQGTMQWTRPEGTNLVPTPTPVQAGAPGIPPPQPDQTGTQGAMQWTRPKGTFVPTHTPIQAAEPPRRPHPQPDQASPFAPKGPYVRTQAPAQQKSPFAPPPQPVQPSPYAPKSPYVQTPTGASKSPFAPTQQPVQPSPSTTPAPKPIRPEGQIRGPLHQTTPAPPQENVSFPPPSRLPVQPQFKARPYTYTPPTTPAQLGAEPSVFPLIQNPPVRPSQPPPQYPAYKNYM